MLKELRICYVRKGKGNTVMQYEIYRLIADHLKCLTLPISFFVYINLWKTNFSNTLKKKKKRKNNGHQHSFFFTFHMMFFYQIKIDLSMSSQEKKRNGSKVTLTHSCPYQVNAYSQNLQYIENKYIVLSYIRKF